MLSQEKTADADTDWKKQYVQILKELDVKEKAWEQQQQELLKTVLRLTFAYQGSNDILDKKLFDLKEALKQSDSKLPQEEIEQIVVSILSLKKEKDTDASRTNQLVTNVIQLLSNDNQFDQHFEAVNEINNDIQTNSIDPASRLKSINDVISNINKSAATKKQKPDTFKVFLRKLAEHQGTETSLADLCKKSIALKSEQEKLKIISQCIEKINSQSSQQGSNTLTSTTSKKEITFAISHLVTMLDWITIPGKSQAKLDTLKQQLAQRSEDADVTSLLRRVALTISNAYMEVQAELIETEGFLKKVTHQLNEITLQVADIETLENESFSNSISLSTEMEKQINLIQTGVDKADSIENIKNTINNRIEVIQNNMDQFISVEQNRKKTSTNNHKKLTDRLNDMESETKKLREGIEKERNKAYTDALTKIPNRMAFDERIAHEYRRWKRYNNKLTLCLIDIDKFKNVNDTYGHKAGDIVLRTVAEKCISKVRGSDFFCRYGGEEFALILPETDLSAAITVAESLRESIEACAFQYGDKTVAITISCGLAEFKGKDNLDTIFKRADKALYEAKNSGRNCCISEDQLHLI
tara:strand:- start:24211 stop:25962 length:1752 start_codon:yes stop_codon:yes gene_type:complete